MPLCQFGILALFLMSLLRPVRGQKEDMEEEKVVGTSVLNKVPAEPRHTRVDPCPDRHG